MTSYNELSAAETERLAILAEECGEVIRIIGKILRFGYASSNPQSGELNRTQLTNELGDLANIIDMMVKAEDLDINLLDYYQGRKSANIHKWLKHQGEENE